MRPLDDDDDDDDAPAAGSGGPRGEGRTAGSVSSNAFAKLRESLPWKRITGQGLSERELQARRVDDVKRDLESLDKDELKDVIKQATDGGERSDRTIRRWKQKGNIADRKIAELVRRRVAIKEYGGVKATARALGRSEGAVYDWRSGRSNDFSKDAKTAMQQHQTISEAVHHLGAGGDDAMPRPSKLIVSGDIEFVGNNTEYGARERTLNLNLVSWSESDVEELILAMAAEDELQTIQVIERAASERWITDGPNSTYQRVYDNSNGFRIHSLTDIKFQM